MTASARGQWWGKKKMDEIVGIAAVSPELRTIINDQAGAPNENIVQNHLNIALLNVF